MSIPFSRIKKTLDADEK